MSTRRRAFGWVVLTLLPACREGPSKEEIAASIAAALTNKESAECTLVLDSALLWEPASETPYLCAQAGAEQATTSCVEQLRNAGILQQHATAGCGTLDITKAGAQSPVPGRVTLTLGCATYSKPVVHSVVREGEDKVKVDYTLEPERKTELQALGSGCKNFKWPTDERKVSGTFVRRDGKWQPWPEDRK